MVIKEITYCFKSGELIRFYLLTKRADCARRDSEPSLVTLSELNEDNNEVTETARRWFKSGEAGVFELTDLSNDFILRSSHSLRSLFIPDISFEIPARVSSFVLRIK